MSLIIVRRLLPRVNNSDYNKVGRLNSLYVIIYKIRTAMEKVAGKRSGTVVFVYCGYTYHIDKRCNGIYRCASRRSLNCYAVLVRNQDETYTLKVPHNHPANETMIQEIEMKQEMLRICRETIMRPKDIFDMVCRR